MMKKLTIIIGVECLLLLAVFHYMNNKTSEYVEAETPNLVQVTITGAILMPGTYQLKASSTLKNLIVYAGDTLPSANLNMIDFNEVLTQKTYHIPFYKDGEESLPIIQKINLNHATIDELKSIPGMTLIRIENFLIYRRQVGVIYDLKELLNVKGIGQKTYEAILPYVTL